MDTNFLLLMLKLKQAINENSSEINNIVTEINKLDLNDEDTISYIKDYFINLKGNIEFIKQVIDKLDVLNDKEALKLYIELSNSFTEITPARIKQILKQDIQFEDKKNTISLYSLIAQAVIFLDDPECLELTINKLELINERGE